MSPAMDCHGCGTSLMAEAFAGPPRIWWASVAAMELIARRHGWLLDPPTCRECQEDDHVR